MMDRKNAFVSAMVLLLIICTGCNNDILDPTQIGRFRPVPVVNVILDSLGVADEPAETYLGAEDPRPEDLVAYEQDYVFGIGDVIRISVYELYREGTPFVQDYVVTETGRISIPDVGQVRAVGLTEPKLEQEIKDILSPDILKNPSVSVLLMNSEYRVYSIFGQGVGRPGRYAIPRYNFRLTDAIAVAGDVAQFNVSYIYVSRDITGREPLSETPSAIEEKIPAAGESIQVKPVEPQKEQKSPEEEMLEIIAPYSLKVRNNNSVISAANFAADEGGTAPTAPAEQQGNTGGIEWVMEQGKWVPVRVGQGTEQVQLPSEGPALKEIGARPLPGQYGLEDIGGAGSQTRVIKVPVEKLLGGDPKYNIIIRPGDRIGIPVDIIGEFWVMGNVNASGPINLTGRPMTLKMAIASAGGLNALAWPKKVDVIRRIGKNKAGLMQEETVMVDLEKIAKGLQPDFFVKPYDLINVGTHGTSRWLAVLRNAFRATYGFGFIYDRNFAERDVGNDPIPGHFSLDSIF